MNINLTNLLLSRRATQAAGQMATVIDPDLDLSRLRELLLDEQGRLRPAPAAELLAEEPGALMLFGHQYGVYQFPTTELVDYLRRRIGDRSAIEIGAGHGVIAQALGIPATDSFVQEAGEIKLLYAAMGQATAAYGAHVERLDAAAAVAHHKPQVVVGCWVTQREPRAMPQGKGQGATHGINEVALLVGEGRHLVDEYIIVGNHRNHGQKQVFRHPKLRVTCLEAPKWLVSRSQRPHQNAIWHITRR